MFELSDKQKMAGELAGEMIKHNVGVVSNELRYGDMELTDDNVKLTFCSSFHEWSFNFMKAFNLRINGNDAEKMGNINEFISILEAAYNESNEFAKKF